MHAQVILYEPSGIRSKRRVTSKETRRFISIYQIHIRRAAPSVDSVSISFVRRRGGANGHAFQLSSFAWCDSDCLPVPLLS